MKRLVAACLLFLISFGTAGPFYAQESEWKKLNDEVKSLNRQGHYDRAVVVAKKALQFAEQAMGPSHPNVATSLNNLAFLYVVQGQYAQAQPLYQRSLAIREKVLGSDHPDVAQSLDNIAQLYRKTGREEAAKDRRIN